MNPGVDDAYTGTLPQASAVAWSVCATVADVERPDTISTSGITGAGLKKCMPATRPGYFEPAASAVIEIDDVFDARIHSGLTTFSTRATSSRFASISSTIASITRSATQTSGSATTVAIRPTAPSASPWLS